MKKSDILLQVGVKILLYNKVGKYLLLRRSLGKYPDILGRWDIVGGRIEVGTPVIDNLHREVHEETGLRIVGQPVLVAVQDILRVPGKHVVRLTYIGQAKGKVRLSDDEHDDYQWFSSEEILTHPDFDVYAKAILTKEFFDKHFNSLASL